MKYRTNLSIAGLPFEIATNHRLVARFVDSYFNAFHSDHTPTFQVEIDSDVPSPASAVGNRVVPEIEPDKRGGYRIINNPGDRIEIGRIVDEGEYCRLSGRTCTDTYLLSSAVRICVQFRLERCGGFFLHAACGSVDGKGVLFTGKSTALRNLHPDAIIAEDAVAIRADEQGVRAYAIPFRGEPPVEANLDALCFPRKFSGIPNLNRETAASIASRLTASALFCAPESERLMADTLSTIAHCSSTVPGYDCFFDSTTDLHAVFSSYGIFN